MDGGAPREATELMTDHTAAGESDLQRRLRRMIELSSLSRVSAHLGVSKEALLRYLASVDLQAGTRVLIEARLSNTDHAPPAPPRARES